jgi:hypothetical protein
MIPVIRAKADPIQQTAARVEVISVPRLEMFSLVANTISTFILIKVILSECFCHRDWIGTLPAVGDDLITSEADVKRPPASGPFGFDCPVQPGHL